MCDSDFIVLPHREINSSAPLIAISYSVILLFQDGYKLVTVCTHGDFIVLLHWEIRSPTP